MIINQWGFNKKYTLQQSKNTTIMKTKLTLLFILLSFAAQAQVAEGQTWEIYKPGIKLKYMINACANGTPNPTGEEFFFCDGPDRVLVESTGLLHSIIYNTHIFSYNGDDYIAFATHAGLSIYNKTQKKWRNLPSFGTYDVTANGEGVANQNQFYTLYDDGNGKLFFSQSYGANRTRVFNLADGSFSNLSTTIYHHIVKNTTNDSFWFVNSARKIANYTNQTFNINDIYGETQTTYGLTSNNVFLGFDIAPDNKLYIAVDGKGILMYDPSDQSHTLTTSSNSNLLTDKIRDVQFDENGNLWIATGGEYNVGGAIIKWDIANDTFTNYTKTSLANASLNVFFDRIEVVNGTVWATSSSQSGAVDVGIYSLKIENGSAVWQFFNESFFKEKGMVEKWSALPSYEGSNGSRYFNNMSSTNNVLYVSTVGNGVLEYKNNKWSNYSALKNNIPTEFGRSITSLKQNKKGGIVFSSQSNISGNDYRGLQIVSYLKNDVITNYPLGDDQDYIDSDQGQVDSNGIFYGLVQEHTNNKYKFRSLQYPNWNTYVNDYALTSNSRDTYAVEGINKWLIDNNTGGNGGRLTNLDTGVFYDLDNSNFNFPRGSQSFLTESRDERVWAIDTAIRWYDPVTDVIGELTVADVTGITHATVGVINKIIFGVSQGEIWLIAQNGVIYLKDGTQKYILKKADYPTLNGIKDAVIDASNTLYVLSSSGFLKISDVNNNTPTTSQFYYTSTVSGIGPVNANYTHITIDNQGNKWFTDGEKMMKFNGGSTAAGITNGATSSSLKNTISGKIYIDTNANNVYDDGVDGVVKNQELNVKNGTSKITVYTDENGDYDFPIYNPNQTYEMALSATDGFVYSSTRIHKVNVTNLDGDYSGNNIPLVLEDIKSLYVKGATKEGAWGFNRPGFENNFVSAIGNLSSTKTFNNVKLRYQFINTNEARVNYVNPTISSVKLFKLVNNNTTHIINKVKISSDRSQNWNVSMVDGSYTKTEIANPVFTEVATDKNVKIEITIGNINPLETYVIEVKTGLFDPVATSDVIQFGPTAVSADNYARGVAEDWLDITPEGNDDRAGRNEDLSPYRDPDEIYQDEDDVYRDQDDVYHDGPYLLPILSSYDPNDKLVTPGVIDGTNEVDITKKWLTYTIRFQNKGNFSAKDIIVLDTLDVNLDRFSFRILESSHPLKIDEIGNDAKSIKRFKFDDIYLPDSLSNPVGSQGYLKYTIKAKTAIAENTVVKNTAHIYFDQNPAIVTNTIQNLFKTPAVASVSSNDLNTNISLYPNPASNTVTIALKDDEAIKKIEIYTLLGRKVMSKFINNKIKTSVEIQQLSKGIYIVKTFGETNTYTKKLMIK